MDATAADYLRAIVLGVIQALTEFLPISSSGHLVIWGELIGEEVSSLTFDVALHIGTLAAVLVYFWRDWVQMAAEAVRDVVRHGPRLHRWTGHARLALLIALGTVPAALVGYLFEEPIEERLRAPWLVALMLIGVGVVMWVVDRRGATSLGVPDVTPVRALVIGAAQALALIPGTSRSGITIVAGRALGFERASAARFSFLLSAPIVFGAGTLRIAGAVGGGEEVMWGPTIAGTLAAAIVGVFVIKGLLAFLQVRTLAVFVWYRIALGLLVLGLVALGVL